MLNIVIKMFLMTGLLTLSQVFYKKLLSDINFNHISPKVFIELIYNFYTLAILISMGSAMFIWSKLLLKNDLTLIYPLVSLSYLWAILAGVCFFDEHVNTNKFLGIIFILIGVILISKK